jgi:hypothetical protein
VEGGPAYHFLASVSPIPKFTAAQLVARTPANALTDMMEWGPAKTALEQYGLLISHEVSAKDLIAPAPDTPSLQDDRPINEYYWLRQNHPQLMKMLQ